MNAARTNIHATAIVIGTRGLLFTGPSGSGKSMLAFACLAAAKREGCFAALVADDQVFVSQHGGRMIAHRPDAIAGLIELRGSGITEVASITSAVLDLAVEVVCLPESERLPPENERFVIAGMGALPKMRLFRGTPEPLATITAFASRFQPEFRRAMPL